MISWSKVYSTQKVTYQVQFFWRKMLEWKLSGKLLFVLSLWVYFSLSYTMPCVFGTVVSVLSSRSRSQWGLMQSKYYCFCYIFWTKDYFVTKLSWLVDYHKHTHNVSSENIILLSSRWGSQRTTKHFSCLSGRDLLNHSTFWTKRGMVIHHRKPRKG